MMNCIRNIDDVVGRGTYIQFLASANHSFELHAVTLPKAYSRFYHLGRKVDDRDPSPLQRKIYRRLAKTRPNVQKSLSRQWSHQPQNELVLQSRGGFKAFPHENVFHARAVCPCVVKSRFSFEDKRFVCHRAFERALSSRIDST